MGSFGAFAIAYFVFARFVGYVVGDVRVRYFDANDGAFFVFTDADFNIRSLLRIDLDVPCAIARRLDGFEDIFYFFPDMAFRDLYCFEVALAVDLATRDRMRAGLYALTRRIVIRVLGRFIVTAFNGTGCIFIGGDGYAAFDFGRFCGFTNEYFAR